jgi:hypothetical protein
MVTRIFSYLILLVAAAQATDEPGWTFFPVNSVEVANGKTVSARSGLAFSFSQPPAERALITAEVLDRGGRHTFAGEVDTDSARGDALLRFPIQSLDHFEVKSLTVQVGRAGIKTIDPHAGQRYRYQR